MNKKLLALSVLIFSAAMLFSAEDLKFSVTPKINYTTGQLGEYLFTYLTENHKPKSVPMEHNQTSLLEWKEKYLFSCGIDSELLLYKHVFFGLSFSAGIPMYVGQMYDYDWFLHTSICQSRSISEEKLTALYYTDFDYGFAINIISSLSLTPFMGISYKYIDFFADDQPLVYQDPKPYDEKIISWDSPDAEVAPGSYISYWRSTIFFWMGTKVDYSPTDKISFSCSFKIAPNISVKSEDNHPGDGTQIQDENGNPYYKCKYRTYYQDMPYGSFKAFDVMVSSQIKINKRLSVNCKFEWLNLSLITGPTYTSFKPGELGSLQKEDFVGATQKDITFSLGLKINLF